MIPYNFRVTKRNLRKSHNSPEITDSLKQTKAKRFVNGQILSDPNLWVIWAAKSETLSIFSKPISVEKIKTDVHNLKFEIIEKLSLDEIVPKCTFV